MKWKSWVVMLVVPVAALAAGVWVKLDPRVNISRAAMVTRVKGYLDDVHDWLVDLPPLEGLVHRIKQNATSDLSVNTDSYSSNGSSTDATTGSGGAASSSSASSSATQTPTESIVQGVQLANTYYYHFTNGTPASVQAVFKQAVAVYNATHIVSIRPGTGTQVQNRITFGTYRKQMGADADGTLELGKGGPEIVKRITSTGDVTAIVNRGTARLNVNYQDAIALPVALHELGHALGLDHNTQSKASVMYPIDQGVTTLSTDDLNGLKSIYGQQ